MEIDIKRTVFRIQIRRFLTLIFVLILIISIILLNDRRNTLLGLNKYQWGIVLGVFYIVMAVLESLLNYHYIYFSDKGENLVLKYFSMRFYNEKKQYIEIPKNEFKGYYLERSFFGLKLKVFFRRIFKGKEVNYPGINISALSMKQRKDLFEALDRVKR